MTTKTDTPIQGIVVDKFDIDVATQNRTVIEAALKLGNTTLLPPGVIHLDQCLNVDMTSSGSTIVGMGADTVLRNSFNAGNAINSTVNVIGHGINYCQFASISDDNAGYMLNDTLPGVGLPWNHPSAQTDLLVPGNVVYTFDFNLYLTQSPPPYKRNRIVSFEPSSRKLILDNPPDPSLRTLKWLSGRPIANAYEGDKRIRLLSESFAQYFPQGRLVVVTSGPSIANNITGEHSYVVSVEGVYVTLDRPLTRDYKNATLAWVDVPTQITFKDLTIDQPVNQSAFPIGVENANMLRFVNVNIPGLGIALTTVGQTSLDDCTVSSLVLNNVNDVFATGGKYNNIYGEEAATNTYLSQLIIEANAGNPVNGVTWVVSSDRLNMTDVCIRGFGDMVAGSGNSCAFIASGRELRIKNVTVSQKLNSGIGYLAGDNCAIDKLTTNGPVTLVSGRNWQLNDSYAPGWDLRLGTTGKSTSCVNVPAVPGWIVK